ncbi:hypothetical protein [Paenibacillus sp. FSL H8-0332]|uniref:hypothetical protein n=1 Tax=Paenibacillus sp. FSL H8-0332 TaxID=2954742 RepID=UPI0030D4B1D4
METKLARIAEMAKPQLKGTHTNAFKGETYDKDAWGEFSLCPVRKKMPLPLFWRMGHFRLE